MSVDAGDPGLSAHSTEPSITVHLLDNGFHTDLAVPRVAFALVACQRWKLRRVSASNVVSSSSNSTLRLETASAPSAVSMPSTTGLSRDIGLIGHVHVGESHRGYLGSGSVDFPAFFRALLRAGAKVTAIEMDKQHLL